MQLRRLGRAGFQVSEIGFGAWAIGGSWGSTDDATSLAAMHAAVDAGVTFFDTADVYGDGRSERLVGQLLRERDEPLVVATKFGRRVPLDLSLYTYENFRAWLERSRENLGVETVDLVQLHSLPWETYYTPSVFEACDRLVEEGLVRAYGVSVEKVEEALKAIEHPGVSTVQIIFNVFRQRPAGLFFEQARARNVGVIARVPLASGLLTGKYKGGIPKDSRAALKGYDWMHDDVTSKDRIAKVRALEPIAKELKCSLAQLSLAWILKNPNVSTVITGASRVEQVRENLKAAKIASQLTPEVMKRMDEAFGIEKEEEED